MDDPGTRIDPRVLAGDELAAGTGTVMPAQFYSRRRSASLEPILRLMAGILIDGVRCFQRNFDARDAKRRREFTDVEFWIFHDKGEGPFSFEDVCNALEIDARRLRDLIVRWEKERGSGDRQLEPRPAPVNLGALMHSHRGRPKSSGSALDLEKRPATAVRGR